MSDKYGCIITPAAQKRLKRHRHAEAQLVHAFSDIILHPERGSELKGDLSGYRSWKVRVKGSGEYRVLYHVDESRRTVVIHWVDTRENFYRDALRQLED